MVPGPAARRELLLFALLLACFPLVALLTTTDPTAPVERARALIGLEQRLGLLSEPAVHAWLRSHDALATVAGWVYLLAHLPALGGALVWAWLERPRAYPVLRDLVLACQAVTLTVYVAWPVAPPRLSGDPRFGDTLAAIMGDGGSSLAHTVQSPFAAVPSGHVVFALLAGGTVVLLARPLVVKLLGALYPPLVVGVVVGTANHFWVDALAAVLVVALAGAAVYAASRSRSARAVDQKASASHGMPAGANARTATASGVVRG